MKTTIVSDEFYYKSSHEFRQQLQEMADEGTDIVVAESSTNKVLFHIDPTEEAIAYNLNKIVIATKELDNPLHGA